MPAAGGEATPIGRDAWLISLCGEPMQIDNEMDRLSEAAGDGIPGSPELATSVRFDQQVRDRRNELISSIYATSVTTLEGLARESRSRPQAGQNDPSNQPAYEYQAGHSLATYILAQAAKAQEPDSELPEVASDFHRMRVEDKAF